jgi:hypothetical protein
MHFLTTHIWGQKGNMNKFDDYCTRGVSFDSGFVSVGYRNNPRRVRLVRTSQ